MVQQRSGQGGASVGRIRGIIVVHTGTIVDEMSGKSGLRNGTVGRIADTGGTIRVVANLGLLRHGVEDVMNERRREEKGKQRVLHKNLG